MSPNDPLHKPTDLRAAAALFAIEEVGHVLERLEALKIDLRAEIRSETQSAVQQGMEGIGNQQELIIRQTLERLKIRASFLEPTQYSKQWLVIVAVAAGLAGTLIGVFLGKMI